MEILRNTFQACHLEISCSCLTLYCDWRYRLQFPFDSLSWWNLPWKLRTSYNHDLRSASLWKVDHVWVLLLPNKNHPCVKEINTRVLTDSIGPTATWIQNTGWYRNEICGVIYILKDYVMELQHLLQNKARVTVCARVNSLKPSLTLTRTKH